MEILRSREAVRRWTAAHHAAGRTVALVPTMGFLHRAHTDLMRAAADHADVVIASIFVNPTQFGPDEDFDRYPRDESGDLEKAKAAGCAAAFLPSVAEMYPPNPSTRVTVATLSTHLCGASRPVFFDGICTIVAKLFHIVGCDVAVFGEKDFQQLAIIRRMVRDLDFPVRIVGHPLVREPDGLAMSSRNAYLSPAQRRDALTLSKALAEADARFRAGERDADTLRALLRGRLEAVGSIAVDYAELVDAETLQPVLGAIDRPTLAAVAVDLGGTRLIDNTVLGRDPQPAS